MKTFHHVLDIAAPRDAVWNALITTDGLAGWWFTEVEAPAPTEGAVIRFTFEEGFNPEMEVTSLDDRASLEWRCTAGYEPWADNTFRFELGELDDGRTRLRFWQHYAVELSDDAYGIYNFNWGYYVESLLEHVTTSTGRPYAASA